MLDGTNDNDVGGGVNDKDVGGGVNVNDNDVGGGVNDNDVGGGVNDFKHWWLLPPVQLHPVLVLPTAWQQPQTIPSSINW